MQGELWAEQTQHPFWEFSLDVYRHQQVKSTCLQLQHRYGLNVNMILFLYWLAKTGRGLCQTADIAMIDRRLKEWHKGITEGLRNIRLTLENHQQNECYASLRRFIQESELMAEYSEQLTLYQLRKYFQKQYPKASDKVQNVIDSLENYTRYSSCILEKNDLENIAHTTHIIFPEVDITFIRQKSDKLSPQTLENL